MVVDSSEIQNHPDEFQYGESGCLRLADCESSTLRVFTGVFSAVVRLSGFEKARQNHGLDSRLESYHSYDSYHHMPYCDVDGPIQLVLRIYDISIKGH